MANNRPMFRGDPYTGIGQLIFDDGRTYDATVEDFTHGKYNVKNGVFFNLEKPFPALSIGRQGDFTLTQYGTDVYNLISQTTRGAANSVIGSDGYRMASGTVSIMTPSGLPLDVNFNGVMVNSPSYQWAIYKQETGIERMVRVPSKYTTTAELQMDYNALYRLATPDEVVLNAAAWAVTDDLAAIIREHWDELREYYPDLQDLPDDFPDVEDNYELVQGVLMAIGSLSNVTMYANHLI